MDDDIRRRRLDLSELAASMTPIAARIKQINATHPVMTRLGEQLKGYAEQVPANLIDLVALGNILQESLGPFDQMMRDAGWTGVPAGFFDSYLKSLPDVGSLRREVLPLNIDLADIDLDGDRFKRWMLDEGLPIAWVPRPTILEALERAPDAAARRRVYGSRWEKVLDDCDDVLDTIASVEVVKYERFAREVISSIREGRHTAAQALAAATLDTIQWREITRDEKLQYVSNLRKPVADPGARGLQRLFLYGQLQAVYRTYQPGNVDPIPATFNRNASVHGVSARQYTRLNAVLGAAHLVSLMRTIDALGRR